ncbi:hypothetical protein GFS31_05830 [Leptolyngbya sp. BL0902]|nr:hypothetical protein GFS31_05830 [Leptolyngbya sp. BL0902]
MRSLQELGKAEIGLHYFIKKLGDGAIGIQEKRWIKGLGRWIEGDL